MLLQADKAYLLYLDKESPPAARSITGKRVHSVCTEPYGGYAMTLFPIGEKPSENYHAEKQV